MREISINAIILNRKDRKNWYIRYTVFFNSKTVTKEISTKVTKLEKSKKWMESKYLPVWIARKKEELQASAHKSTTFKHYACIFLENYQDFHDYQNIEYRTNRIISYFGDIDIRKITKLDIKQFLDGLRHNKTQEKLSKNSKSKYLRVIRGIFQVADDDGVVNGNFTYDIKINAKENRNLLAIKPFNKTEVAKLLEISKDVKYGKLLHLYLGVAFHQGMSPSEIIALQIGDIDTVHRTINIHRNITKGRIKETKTVYRDRIIPIFDTTMPYIIELIREAKLKKSIWLFSNDDGTHLNDIRDIRGNKLITKNMKVIKKQTKWYKLLSDAGIEYRDIKNCRHTFAVSAIESKQFTMQQVANLLGHGSLQMIIHHYAKFLDKKAIDADRKIDLYGDTFSDTKNRMNFG